MSNLYKGNYKKEPIDVGQYRTENNNYINPLSQSHNSIYFRDKIKQNNPGQKDVFQNNYHYRSLSKGPTDFNHYKNPIEPIEKDNFNSYGGNFTKREFNPYITRHNLANYLRTGGSLYNNREPNFPSNRINKGNFERNYNTYYQKNFPLINRNLKEDGFNYTHGFNTPHLANNNREINYKLEDSSPQNNGNYGERNDYKEQNIIKDNNYENIKNIQKSTDFGKTQNIKKEGKVNEYSYNNKYITTYYKPYVPPVRRSFHKTQIFNNYKPFMVDDFKEFAEYE